MTPTPASNTISNCDFVSRVRGMAPSLAHYSPLLVLLRLSSAYDPKARPPACPPLVVSFRVLTCVTRFSLATSSLSLSFNVISTCNMLVPAISITLE